MVKRDRSLGSAERVARAFANVLGGCEIDREVRSGNASLSPSAHWKPKKGPSNIRRKSLRNCETLNEVTRTRQVATRVEMTGRNAGAELLEDVPSVGLSAYAKRTTATRDGDKWSRGSVQTKATRSVSSEGIRNEARKRSVTASVARVSVPVMGVRPARP